MLKSMMTEEKFHNIKMSSPTKILGLMFQPPKDIPEVVLKRAAERGKAVHASIEKFINTGKIDISFEYEIFMVGFKEWYNKYRPIWMASELMIVNEELGLKGIIDTIYEIDGKTVLCDFKTNSNIDEDAKKRFTLQLSMYKLLAEAEVIHIDELRILNVNKKGEFKYIKIEYDEFAARSLMYLYNYVNGGK